MEDLSLVAPVKERARQLFFSSTLRTITGLASGNLVAMVLGIIGSLVQARFVTPEDLGYFRGFSIVSGYAFFLHLGLFGALQRLYPYYIGKGQKERAIAVAEICQAWNVAVSAIVSGAFLALAIASLVSGNWRAMLGWLVQAVAMASFIYGGYLGATYRSGHDFATVAKGSVISSVVNTLTLPFFLSVPYLALALRSSLGSLAGLAYLHARRPLRLHWRFNWKEWSAIVKEGLGIFVAGYVASTGWAVIEASVILARLGTQFLGFWSMSFMIFEAVNKIPGAVIAVYIPRVTETYGRTGTVSNSIQLCYKPVLWGTLAMLALVMVVCLALPFVVPVLMPYYVDAIPTMWLMMLYLPIAILDLPYNILVAMGRLAHQNIISLLGLTSFAILTLFALEMGLGLNGVVGASLLGKSIKIASTYALLYTAQKSET